MEKISVYIVTLNEEARIGRTIEAARQIADEVLVVDSGSTDRTCAIAKALGARVMFHPWKNISAQKHVAQEACRNAWVLSLDADEVLSAPLINEIKREMAAPKFQAYRMRIVDFYPGQAKPAPFAKTYNQVRLYNRAAANMPDDLTHDRVIVGSGKPVGQLNRIVQHYSYLTLRKTWEKFNDYTDELVNTAFATGKSYSLARLVIEFPFQFFRYYILRGMVFQGKFGFINAVTGAYFRFLKIAKWHERKTLRSGDAAGTVHIKRYPPSRRNRVNRLFQKDASFSSYPNTQPVLRSDVSLVSEHRKSTCRHAAPSETV